MLIDKARIAALIPHHGAMCLLDRVEHWSADSIRCIARNHREATNPLRHDGTLSALSAIEYAAQAMAVHGGLAASNGEQPRTGYLVSLRDIDCRLTRIDDLPGELVVDAERSMSDDGRCAYRFRISVAGSNVISGRATVVLDAGKVLAAKR